MEDLTQLLRVRPIEAVLARLVCVRPLPSHKPQKPPRPANIPPHVNTHQLAGLQDDLQNWQ